MNTKKMLYILFYKLNNLFQRLSLKGKQEYILTRIQCGKGSRFYESAEVDNLQARDKLSIGDNTHVRGELFVYPYGEGLTIGDNCYIGRNTVIRAGHKIWIGNSVLIAHNVTIIDSDSHELDAVERDLEFKKLISLGHPKNAGNVRTAPICIHEKVWISYNVAILKGVTIGEGAIVGAGSVVTKDVPAWTLVVGNPARIIKKIPH